MTPEQIERARRAGWNPDHGEPPEGWDAHGAFQEGVVPGVFSNLDDALAAEVPSGQEVTLEDRP